MYQGDIIYNLTDKDIWKKVSYINVLNWIKEWIIIWYDNESKNVKLDISGNIINISYMSISF